MRRRALVADLLLLLTACIWGFGFVAQRSGMKYIGPFSFNGIRFVLGSLSLLPLILYRKRRQGREIGSRENMAHDERKADAPLETAAGGGWLVFKASLAAGSCLFIAVAFQQFGIMFTTAGNAGFITGLYVVLTPIFGIFLGKKTGLPTWIGAALTFIGLYFLSTAGSTGNGGLPASMNTGDLLIVVSAVFWTFHVLLIDHLVKRVDPIALSAGQFLCAAVYALCAAFLIETAIGDWLKNLAARTGQAILTDWISLPVLCSGLASGEINISLLYNAVIPILYGGLASVGIGYTLQVVAQRDAPPAHATIILCLEGGFAAFGGILILHEPFGTSTLLGCLMMLSGMLISQWEVLKSVR